jgi:hypothetical protein
VLLTAITLPIISHYTTGMANLKKKNSLSISFYKKGGKFANRTDTLYLANFIPILPRYFQFLNYEQGMCFVPNSGTKSKWHLGMTTGRGERGERPGRSIGAFQLLPPRASTTAVVTFPCHSQTCNSNCFHCSCHECVNTETLLRRSETLQPERKLYCFCVALKSAAMDIEFMKQTKNLNFCLIST